MLEQVEAPVVRMQSWVIKGLLLCSSYTITKDKPKEAWRQERGRKRNEGKKKHEPHKKPDDDHDHFHMVSIRPKNTKKKNKSLTYMHDHGGANDTVGRFSRMARLIIMIYDVYASWVNSNTCISPPICINITQGTYVIL